eukprot:10659585-Prorocentrum_lima.AAC.1
MLHHRYIASPPRIVQHPVMLHQDAGRPHPTPAQEASAPAADARTMALRWFPSGRSDVGSA